MKFVYVAAAFALAGLTGVVQAEATNPDESMFTLDLESATGHAYFIKCKSGTNLLNCKGPSVWEQTNGYPGLQTALLPIGKTRFEPDTMLLG